MPPLPLQSCDLWMKSTDWSYPYQISLTKKVMFRNNLIWHDKLTVNEIILKLWPTANYSAQICFMLQKLCQWSHNIILMSFRVFFPFFFQSFYYFSKISYTYDTSKNEICRSKLQMSIYFHRIQVLTLEKKHAKYELKPKKDWRDRWGR